MAPLKSLERNSRCLRLERLPSCGGIVPLSQFTLRDILLTRPWLSVEIPCQSESGFSLSQFVLLFQLAPPVALYRATNAILSAESSVPAVAVGVGVGVSASLTSACVGVGVGVGKPDLYRRCRWGWCRRVCRSGRWGICSYA